MSLQAEIDALRTELNVFKTSTSAFNAYVASEINTLRTDINQNVSDLRTDMSALELKAKEEPIAFAWGGSPVVASMINIPLAHNLSIPANLAGSRYFNGTNPLAASTFTLTRQPGNTTIGTISVSTSGVATFSGAGSNALVAGDSLRMTATTIGGSLANVGITIAATRR